MNDIGDEGASALAAVLKETKICNLDIDGHALQIDELKGTKPTEKIDLSNKWLGVASAIIIASCIKENGVLKELNLADNQLCGLDRYGHGTYTAEGITKLCEGLKGSAVTSLDVGYNNITGDAADHLAKVVLEHAIMTDFCGIPLVSLRENRITELDLENKGVGVPGAIVLSKLLPSAAALTSLNLRDNGLNEDAEKALRDAVGSDIKIKF